MDFWKKTSKILYFLDVDCWNKVNIAHFNISVTFLSLPYISDYDVQGIKKFFFDTHSSKSIEEKSFTTQYIPSFYVIKAKNTFILLTNE